MIIEVNRMGQVADLDMLSEVERAVSRNMPADAQFTLTSGVSQALKIAAKALRSSHVFTAEFGDGTVLTFIGDRLPNYVTRDMLLAQTEAIHAAELKVQEKAA